MLNLERKQYWFVGLGVSIISFALLLIGVMGILSNTVTPTNVVAYLIFSALVGLIVVALGYYKLKAALVLFLVGIVLGYGQMFRSFISGMSGWGDLIGVLSLFIWIIIGLVAGLVTQLGVYLYNKNKKQ